MKSHPIALITGASEGIGRATSLLLAHNGYDLILVSRNIDRLNELKKKIEATAQVQVTVIPFDLRKVEKIRNLFADVQDLDVLINNAGHGQLGTILATSTNEYADTVLLNGLAPMECAKYAMKIFKDKQKLGCIINVSSIAAFFPTPYFSAYSASKALLNNWSQALEYETEKSIATISTLCLGPIKTSFSRKAGISSQFVDKYAFLFMSPETAAKAIYRCISKPRSLFVLGLGNSLVLYILKFLPLRLQITLTGFLYKKIYLKFNMSV